MSMKLSLGIEDLGNIEKINITIKPLTILAGENSTGKTFITKTLYTVLDSVYKNHFIEKMYKNYIFLDISIEDFIENISATRIDNIFHDNYLKISREISDDVFYDLQKCKFGDQEDIIRKYIGLFESMEDIVRDYVHNRRRLKKFSSYKHELDLIENNLDEFMETLNNRESVVINGISESLEDGFKKNFQVAKLNFLIRNNSKNKSLKIKLDNLGEIVLQANQSIAFRLKTDGIEEIQNVENIVFFDSPVYFKVKKAIENCKQIRYTSSIKNEDKYMKGYPQYLDKLYDYIEEEYMGESDFFEISQNIKNIIHGSFQVTQSGELQYKDSEDNIIPLSMTAMGVSNIGIIELLLRNNVINKGSFLIMDEPEAHLHPEWQVLLADVLYDIAKRGANVIIATHSLDILKAFQTRLIEDRNADEIISVNKMPFDKDFYSKPELGKINLLINNLKNPFDKLSLRISG